MNARSRPFDQEIFAAVAIFVCQSDFSPNEKAVLLAVGWFADRDLRCQVFNDDLLAVSGMARSSFYRTCKQLREAGHLRAEPQERRGRNHAATLYALSGRFASQGGTHHRRDLPTSSSSIPDVLVD